MKCTSIAMSLLLAANLTSCHSQDESMALDHTNFAHAATASNIIYLHHVVIRGQEASQLFNTYIKSGNVIVDFYADWCQPCKIMGRTIDQLAPQNPSITFLKVDIDQFKSIATGIQSIPTLIFHKNGSQVARITGAKDKNSMMSLIKKWYL